MCSEYHWSLIKMSCIRKVSLIPITIITCDYCVINVTVQHILQYVFFHSAICIFLFMDPWYWMVIASRYGCLTVNFSIMVPRKCQSTQHMCWTPVYSYETLRITASPRNNDFYTSCEKSIRPHFATS